MDTKHTAGLWYNTGNEIRHAQRSIILATVYKHLESNMTTGEQLANAKLIAAAPELLDALNHIIERISVVRPNDAFCQALKDKAIDAINKAL